MTSPGLENHDNNDNTPPPAPTPASTPAPTPPPAPQQQAPDSPSEGVAAALTSFGETITGLTQAIMTLVSEKKPDATPGKKGAWFQRRPGDET